MFLFNWFMWGKKIICSNVYFLHGLGVGVLSVYITQNCVDHRLLAGWREVRCTNRSSRSGQSLLYL